MEMFINKATDFYHCFNKKYSITFSCSSALNYADEEHQGEIIYSIPDTHILSFSLYSIPSLWIFYLDHIHGEVRETQVINTRLL